MYEFLGQVLQEIYMEDKKKLRTKTIKYGNLYEDRWQTHLQPSLSKEDIEKLESRMNQKIPIAFKEFLSFHNGCYLFDLIRVAGKAPDTYKGLSVDEQNSTTVDLEEMDSIYRRKRTPESHFIFADSIVKNTYYVFDKDENVLEIDYRTKKIKENYENLKTLFCKVVQEGKENVKSGRYYEFR